MASGEGLLSSYASSEDYSYDQGGKRDSSSKYDVPSDWAHRSARSSTTPSEAERREWRHAFEAGTTPDDAVAWGEVLSHRSCAARAATFSAALFVNMLVIKSWCALGLSSDSRHHCFGFEVEA